MNGEVSSQEALRQTLRATRLESGPIGSIRLDEYGTPILDVHIREVKRRDDRLVNAILTTYHEVGQFWHYDPAKFLAEPVYSRDYPPARYLE
jgi:branched-chain amino acid transport system substrate-binding protein